MIGRLRQLACDVRGAAAAEFAAIATFFFFVVMGGLDVGMYHIQQAQLGEAVSAAAVSAFQNRDSVNFNGMSTFVSQASRAPSGTVVTVTTRCNGGATTCGNSSRTCACLNQAGTYTLMGSCTASCTSGNTSTNSKAGYYLTISASYTYRPILLPQGFLTGKTVQRTATARLQ